MLAAALAAVAVIALIAISYLYFSEDRQEQHPRSKPRRPYSAGRDAVAGGTLVYCFRHLSKTN